MCAILKAIGPVFGRNYFTWKIFLKMLEVSHYEIDD